MNQRMHIKRDSCEEVKKLFESQSQFIQIQLYNLKMNEYKDKIKIHKPIASLDN